MSAFASRHRWLRASLVVLVAACACSSTQRLSEESRQRLRIVAIDTHVDVPEAMHFFGESERTAGFFGMIGILTNAAIGDRPQDRFTALERANGIGIGEIVRNEFLRQLEQRGTFRQGEPGDASLTLEVLSYGMSVPSGFKTGLVPMLTVRATLFDAEQRVLWRTQQKFGAWETSVPPVGQYMLEGNPAKLRRFWQAAAEVVTRQILDTLQP